MFQKDLLKGYRILVTGGGTGLGLSLVTEDLRLHQGRVWVEDRADGRSGARFVLELPFTPLLGESEV